MGQTNASQHDRYFLQKIRLGQGSFGTVWRAIDRVCGSAVAMKHMDKAKMRRNGVRQEDIEREIAMMRACKHENIIKLYSAWDDVHSVYIAQEYCDGGDFGDKLKERGMTVREEEAAGWVKQMCSAIAALHNKSICHRDVKPDNFMVSSCSVQDAPEKQNVLKLADFGLSVFIPKGTSLTQKCGTPAWMAPELHLMPKRSRGYGFPADVWAVGVSMYQIMFGGLHPFLDDKGMLQEQEILKGFLDFRPPKALGYLRTSGVGGAEMRFSGEAHQLCRNMVDIDPVRRLIAAEALRHPWVERWNASSTKVRQSCGSSGPGGQAVNDCGVIFRPCNRQAVSRASAVSIEDSVYGTAAWKGIDSERPRIQVGKQFDAKSGIRPGPRHDAIGNPCSLRRAASTDSQLNLHAESERIRDSVLINGSGLVSSWVASARTVLDATAAEASAAASLLARSCAEKPRKRMGPRSESCPRNSRSLAPDRFHAETKHVNKDAPDVASFANRLPVAAERCSVAPTAQVLVAERLT